LWTLQEHLVMATKLSQSRHRDANQLVSLLECIPHCQDGVGAESFDDFRIADLLVEREDLLIEKLRCLGVGSPQRRLRIRAQLAKIRGELERLGLSDERSVW